MSDDLAVGLGGELGALPFQLPAQLAEVLDDAVVHDGEPVGRVRMGVVLGRAPVRCPAGVADADRAGERFARELCFQVLELAFSTPPRQRAVLQRRHAGRIVAAIFEALERFDELRGDRLAADDSDNAAHLLMHSPNRVAEPNSTPSPPRTISTSRCRRCSWYHRRQRSRQDYPRVANQGPAY